VTRVDSIDVVTARLPFRFSFGHALAERRDSTNVYVRLLLDDGTVGYGEGVPREYVTGETVESAVTALCERQAPALLGRSLAGPEDVEAAIDDAAPLDATPLANLGALRAGARAPRRVRQAFSGAPSPRGSRRAPRRS